MSEKNAPVPEETPSAPEGSPDAGELRDDELEEAAGGVIGGGCIPTLPWEPVPTFPTFPD